MASNSSTPLWLDLKVEYIDENFDKVLSYIRGNSQTEKDGFYEITINLLEQRVNALVQEFHNSALLQDEALFGDQKRTEFVARLLGLYLLAVNTTSKNYRTAFLLFVFALAQLASKNISPEFIGNVCKLVFGTLPPRILEWSDLEEFNPNIVAHKLSDFVAKWNGAPQDDSFEMMGLLNLSDGKMQLAAINRVSLNQSFAPSFSIFEDRLQVVSPRSAKLKQSQIADLGSLKEFTEQFIVAQQKVCPKLKRYIAGEEITVKLIGLKNRRLQVTTVNDAYEPIVGEVVFSKNFFGYKDQDFIDALQPGDEFAAVYLGDNQFEVKTSFIRFVKNDLFEENTVVLGKAIAYNEKQIIWGVISGFSVYTPKIQGVEMGDCAELKLTSMPINADGDPIGWVYGSFERLSDEQVDYARIKIETIEQAFVYEKEERTVSVPVLSTELIKALYRMLIFGQQHCVVNPTSRYQILCVCQMLATLIGQFDDVRYVGFLAAYLENLVRFAKGEYNDIQIPEFVSGQASEGVVRRGLILAILQAYGKPANGGVLDQIIAANGDPFLVKLAILVQSCNRLEDVINRSMQNVIKREIITSLSVETEGETDLEVENGIYLGIENDRQEFKTSFFYAPQNAKEQRQSMTIFKSLCAFLNTTEGGTLYLGVNDLGYVQGVATDMVCLQSISYGNYKGVDGYIRYITDQAKKVFDIDVVANIKIRPMYDNQVFALEVAPYEFGIVKIEGVAYLRVNSESVALNEAAIQRISSRKQSSVVQKDSRIEALSSAIRQQQCVVLHNYQSSNSGSVSDRTVEVFDFTDDGTSVWCYDLEKNGVRLFHIARIGYVTITQQAWSHQNKHRQGVMDVFNMTGNAPINICLRLNLRAKNLLLEEYPRAKNYLSKETDNSWLLTTEVYNLRGVGRFFMGLANSIEIVSGPELVAYVKEYCHTYLMDIL